MSVYTTKQSTPVAYGCPLSSVVGYNNFAAVARVGPLKNGMWIKSICGKGIKRGEMPTSPKKKDGEKVDLMKHCAIVRVVMGDNVASVKIFNQYLHICKVGISDAEKVADFICQEMKATQDTIKDEDLLRERLLDIIKVDSHIPEEEIDSVIEYYRNADICLKDLSHEKVKATMTNTNDSLGSCIHTPRLARLLRDEKRYRRWIVTFDNALSMSIRVLIPFADSDKKGYNFAIQPSGDILYSDRDEPASRAARDELYRFIQERMDKIRL